MTPPITFTETPNGKIEAMLGNKLIGFVERYPYSGTDFGRVEATYQMRLPIDGAIPSRQPATTMAMGKKLLLLKIAAWHEDADAKRYAEMIVALRAQAEGEGA